MTSNKNWPQRIICMTEETVDGILRTIRTLGRLVDAADKADKLAASYEAKVQEMLTTTSE